MNKKMQHKESPEPYRFIISNVLALRRMRSLGSKFDQIKKLGGKVGYKVAFS